MRHSKLIAICILGAGLSVPGHAQTPNDKQSRIDTAEEEPVFGAAPSIGEDRLRLIAGREDVVQESRADQTAAVSRNSVGDNVTTGNAKIDGQAFQNMSGLSILNVNTGNNVAINAALNVNVSISPNP